MRKYLLPIVAGILAVSADVVVAAPWGGGPPRSSQKSQGYHHGKKPMRGYGHQSSRRSGWNDRIEVRAQRRLQNLGYYRGRIDGDFGRGSRSALVRFQRDKRLRVTGRLDRMTIRALRI